MPNANDLAAANAAFRSFANSYLREIECGSPVFHRDGQRNYDCTEIALARGDGRLRLEMASRSLCGPHLFGRIWQRTAGLADWREIEPIFAVHLLIRAARKEGSAILHHAELELLERVLLGYGTMRRCLAAPAEDVTTFIEAEQSLYYGHPLHPTPKSLQGMSEWQQAVYAPESNGRFQLHWFSVCPTLFRNAAAGGPVSSIVRELLGDDFARLSSDRPIIPVHPLQAEALFLEPYVKALIASGKLQPLGPAGPYFTATSSVRTVFCQDFAWMPKFSLPVRITNSKRINRRFELDDGVAIARFFDAAGLNDFHPRMGFWHDRAYASVDIPDLAESGFEVIFRENPLHARPGARVFTVSALTAEPVPGGQSLLARIIDDIARNEKLPVRNACRRWFEAYLDCVLDPAFDLYDRYGVGLEAHQQNSLLDFDEHGYPRKFIYRDSQGFYLSTALRERWCGLTPELEATRGLFFDDHEIQGRFTYYLVVNQIFGVIARAGHDNLASEAELLGLLRARFKRLVLRLSGSGRDLARHILESTHITAKANLITRLRDMDELQDDGGAVYIQFPNPLATVGMAIASERIHALAS